jgi:hypothetical protein
MSDLPIEERPCAYCGAEYDAGGFDHAEDCPSNIGLFPVREEDVRCPGCKQTYIGMRCIECVEEF